MVSEGLVRRASGARTGGGPGGAQRASPPGSGHLGKGQSGGQPGAARFAGGAARFEGHDE